MANSFLGYLFFFFFLLSGRRIEILGVENQENKHLLGLFSLFTASKLQLTEPMKGTQIQHDTCSKHDLVEIKDTAQQTPLLLSSSWSPFLNLTRTVLPASVPCCNCLTHENGCTAWKEERRSTVLFYSLSIKDGSIQWSFFFFNFSCSFPALTLSRPIMPVSP